MRLKEMRQALNLKQKDVADALGISVQAYSNYENGNREPDFETLSKLADFFSVTIDYLIGRSDKRDGIVLDGVYFRIASEAQELGVPPEDIEKIISLYRKYKK